MEAWRAGQYLKQENVSLWRDSQHSRVPRHVSWGSRHGDDFTYSNLLYSPHTPCPRVVTLEHLTDQLSMSANMCDACEGLS